MITVENMKKNIKKYIKKFKELDINSLNLHEGEYIVHCIDNKSFGGKFFIPEWAVTNMGRGYSLWKEKWLIPQATGTRKYWFFTGSKQVAVHNLVMNYFRDESDEIALEEFGEDGVEAHHEIPIEIPEELKYGTSENAQARIEHCMKYNCKKNLCYQKKNHNRSKDKLIINGKETKEEKNGEEKWSNHLKETRSMFSVNGKIEGNNNGARIVYSRDENGKLIETVKMNFKMNKEYSEKNAVIIDIYKVNCAGENKQFIETNKEKILESIKRVPPKSTKYRNAAVIEDRVVYYALA